MCSGKRTILRNGGPEESSNILIVGMTMVRVNLSVFHFGEPIYNKLLLYVIFAPGFTRLHNVCAAVFVRQYRQEGQRERTKFAHIAGRLLRS